MDIKILAVAAFVVVAVVIIAVIKNRPAKPHKGPGSPYNQDIDNNPK